MKTTLQTLILTLSLVLFTACGGGGGTTTSTTAATSDTTAPVITVIDGNRTTYALQNTTYTDAGATALDNVDGNVTVTTTGTVNTATLGDYNITYSATDATGNTATSIRTVTVVVSTVTHNGTPYGMVISPYTGKVWLDRNLGAAQVCTLATDTACYGDYYQWGRNFDGHENSRSGTINTQATNVNTAGSTFFIKGFLDWASVDINGSIRAANWSKTDGTSVCPVGFRVPTIAELQAETINKGVTNSATAFSNFLKLPSAGRRYSFGGSVSGVGSWGDVWSSSASGSNASFLYFDSGSAYWSSSVDRAYGRSVRCLRD